MGISRMEVELSLGRIVKAIILRKLHQIWRSQEVFGVFRVIIAQPALVARHIIGIARYACGKPAMATCILQIPHFLVVYEANAESFGRTIFGDERAQTLHTLTGGVYVRQHNVVGTVLCQSVGHVRVIFQGLVAAEDGFSRAHAHACRVKSGTAPLARKLEVGQPRIAQSLFGKVAPEGAVLGHKLLRTVVGVAMKLIVNGHHGIEVARTA